MRISLEMQDQATREQKAKQRLANRAKRSQNKHDKTEKINKNHKTIVSNKTNIHQKPTTAEKQKTTDKKPINTNTSKKVTRDKQNASLPEITTKISGMDNVPRVTHENISIERQSIESQSTERKSTERKSTEHKSNKNKHICARYIGRHASAGASSITSHRSSNRMKNGAQHLTSSSDSVLSSSSIELISSNESLNHAKSKEETSSNQKHNNIIFNENKAMRNSADHFYNVKQAAAEKHQKYKVVRTNSTHTNNTLRNTSDNGFSSSSSGSSDYSYGVSAAVVMPREIRSNQKSKNYFVKINGQSLNSFHSSSSYTSNTSLTSSANNRPMPESLSDRKKTTIIVHKIPEGVQASSEYNYGICVLKVCR